MALNKTITFDLELKPGGIPPIVHASQGDIGRMFKANIYWDGSAATSYISGATVNLRGRKPDKTVFDYSATLAGSMVTFETTEQMTIISGPVECELVFSNDGDVIASANFVLIVEESPYDPNAISESEIEGINAMIQAATPEAVADWFENDAPTSATFTNAVSTSVDAYLDENGVPSINPIYNKGFTVVQGYWAIANGNATASNTWCRSDYYVPFDFVLKTSTVEMLLQAYTTGDAYVGTWNGTEFSNVYVQTGRFTELNINEWMLNYPAYKFKITFYKGGATFTPTDVENDLSISIDVDEKMSLISEKTDNLFTGSFSSLQRFKVENGKLISTAADTRTFFNCYIYFRNGETTVDYTNASITTTGRKSFTVTTTGTGDNIRIMHGGSAVTISCYIPLVFSSGETYTVSFDVESYDPRTVGGLVLSKIQIETGSTATVYMPMYSASDYIARNEINTLNAKVDGLQLPGYWKTYLDGKKDDINDAVFDVGNHGVVFAFFTDYHYLNTDYNYQGFSWLPLIFKYCKDELLIPEIINGGDILTTHTTKTEALEILETFRNDFNSLGVKNIHGNHDTNPYATDNSAILAIDEVYSILYRGMGMEESVNLEPGLYWYKDNHAQKVRVVAPNTHDTNTQWYQDTTQRAWFVETLNSTPAGYTLVIIPHIAVGFSGDEIVLSATGQNIKTIVDAYVNRSSGTWDTVPYNFTNAAGTVSCVLTGHAHRDGAITTGSYPIIYTVCDAMWGSNQDPERGQSTVRTTNEHAFDIMCIDTTAKSIVCKRIGSGQDRTYTYT